MGAGFKTVFVARGVTQKGAPHEMVTRFSGPEPGYVATSSMVLESCLSVLEAQARGTRLVGVMTPALALVGTRFASR